MIAQDKSKNLEVKMTKGIKMIIPADRTKHVELVFEERIGELIKGWGSDKLLGSTSLIRYLVHSAEAWEQFSRWRMEVRTEALRRYELSDEYRGYF